MEYTPEIITSLKSNEIFVFGSNEAGIHGAGAAAFAEKRLGAKRGQGFGRAGKTFAIPTKDWNIETLPLPVIEFYVHRFLEFAKPHNDYYFYVTKIGCGLAGLSISEIAPMFASWGKIPAHVILPVEFHTYVTTQA